MRPAGPAGSPADSPDEPPRRPSRWVRSWARGGVRAVRSATHAGGAGESGLARVLELHLVQTVGDTLVLTALASTIFFAVPTEEARGRVATSLLVTMVPFIVLAPLLGPLLDRVRRGRRYALGTTMVVRSFLAWVMADAVLGAAAQDGSAAQDTPLSLYLAAFGFLVCQKAYLVTRAAAVPRVLPDGVGLVAANARITLAGVAAMTVAGPLGAGLTSWLGPQYALWAAFAVFIAGTALALALDPVVDVAEGEQDARLSAAPEPDADPRRWNLGPRVVLGLRVNAAVRAFTGFLTLFLAFRLRAEPLPGLGPAAVVAAVVALAAVGGGLGTAVGSRLRRVDPERVAVAGLLVTGLGCGAAAAWYGVWAVLSVALVAGFAQSLLKLCLDALIQQDVPERVRTSAFARSETVVQLAWVIGGLIGLWLPVPAPWGLAGAATAVGVTAVAVALRSR